MSLLKGQQFNSVKVSINNAALITLQSVPVVLIPAQGAGKAIQVISASVNYTYGTSAFATLIALFIRSSTVATPATDYQAICSKIMNTTANTFQQFTIPDVSITSAAPTIIANDSLVIAGDADDAAGDGSVDIFVSYLVLNV